MGIARRLGAAFAVLALWAAAPASAQENLDKGKTPAELYASDCAICHKSPSGLSRGANYYGLTGFLREHYTASRQAAATIAAYLQKIDRAAAPRRPPGPRRKAKASDAKLPPARPAAARSSQTKSSETKPAETTPTEAKASDGEPPLAERDEAKAAAAKDAAKAETPKPGADKPPADANSDKKAD